MSAKEQAIHDIREELRSNHKAFISFHKELNPIMDELVNNHIKAQEKAFCVSCWTVK